MGVLCLTLICYVLLFVHSSFAIVLKRKRKLVALLLLPCRCLVTVNPIWPFLTVPWVCLQCVIVVFPDHSRLPFGVQCSLKAFIETCQYVVEKCFDKKSHFT